MGKVSESKCNHMIEGMFWLPTELKQPYGYKFRDRARCISCGMLQPKSQTEPDYLMAIVWGLVEVKGPHKAWNWSTGEAISDLQRNRLDETKGWLFLELGEGNRPSKTKAFLIPWSYWRIQEKRYEAKNIKSITLNGTKRLPAAVDDLALFMLEWKDSHWIIPPEHEFWYRLENGMKKMLAYTKEIRNYYGSGKDRTS